MKTKISTGFELIDRTLRTTAIVLSVFFPFGVYYMGLYPALAVLSGGVWGMLNFIFITFLVKVTIGPEGANLARASIIALIKFPLLYLTGYFLLKVPQFEPLYLLAGFSGLLLIVVLKVLGRALLGMDKPTISDKSNEGMSAV